MPKDPLEPHTLGLWKWRLDRRNDAVNLLKCSPAGSWFLLQLLALWNKQDIFAESARCFVEIHYLAYCHDMVISFFILWSFAFQLPAPRCSSTFSYFFDAAHHLSPLVECYHTVQVHSEFYCSRIPLQTGCITYIWHINDYRSTARKHQTVFSLKKKKCGFSC